MTERSPAVAGEASIIGRNAALEITLEALLVSTGIVALAEIGDKTQLLSLALATRYKRPWPIIVGILVATLLNHALAAALGTWLTGLAHPEVLR